MHVFSISAAMVGVCLTAIGIIRLVSTLGSGVYVPFELVELSERFTWLSFVVLVVNLAIVAFMLFCVFRADREKPVSSFSVKREHYARRLSQARNCASN